MSDKGAVRTDDVELVPSVAPTAQDMERKPFRPRAMCETSQRGDEPSSILHGGRDVAATGSRSIYDTHAEAEKWALEWWASYEGKVKAHDKELYFEAAGLLAQLEGEVPPVKLLRGTWLLERTRQLDAIAEGARQGPALHLRLASPERYILFGAGQVMR